MRNRRLIPLGLGAVALLVIVGLAARGGSLHSGGGRRGPSVLFWDFAFSTLFVLEILAVIAAIWVAAGLRDTEAARSRLVGRPGKTLRWIAFLLISSALLFYVLQFLRRHDAPGNNPGVIPQGAPAPTKHASPPIGLQWEVIVVVLALVVAVGVAYVVQRKRLGQTQRRLGAAPEAVAAALDGSLDDLRSDPDLRRAIVAAYARMEGALAAMGMPRYLSEAPLEYVERVLLSLDASADAVRRLTDLFEWARFSHHEPEPSMRDEAVEALIAVRDELRDAERQAA